jgi:hypothetical protein
MFNIHNDMPIVAETQNTNPFILSIMSNVNNAEILDQLEYDSFHRQLLSIKDKNETKHEISHNEEQLAKKILINSDFFNSTSIYLPPSDTRNYAVYNFW